MHTSTPAPADQLQHATSTPKPGHGQSEKVLMVENEQGSPVAVNVSMKKGRGRQTKQKKMHQSTNQEIDVQAREGEELMEEPADSTLDDSKVAALKDRGKPNKGT